LRTTSDFQRELNLIINVARARGTLTNAQMGTALTYLSGQLTSQNPPEFDRTLRAPTFPFDFVWAWDNPTAPTTYQIGQPAPYFQRQVLKLINSNMVNDGNPSGVTPAAMATVLTNIATALSADAGYSDITITQPANAALIPHAYYPYP
jgi:hypothetical protein